jgi:hypothetical protein
MTIFYKIKDNDTGLFFTNSTKSFDKTGKLYKKRKSAELALIKHLNHVINQNANKPIYENSHEENIETFDLYFKNSKIFEKYSIIEEKMIVESLSEQVFNDYHLNLYIRQYLTTYGTKYISFWDDMITRGVEKEIIFISYPNYDPKISYYYNRSMFVKKELKRLNVESKYYKNHNNIFGFTDELKFTQAKLGLEWALTIDLRSVREQYEANYKRH